MAPSLGHEVFDGFRIEIAYEPGAGFAQDFFAAEFVEIQDECGFFLFGHGLENLRGIMPQQGIRCK